MKLTTLTIAISTILAVQPLWAEEETELSTITVEGTKLSDVSGEEVKSADLAEALTKKVPSISIVRRSGIANDIILRGQKKDNINILIDNAKVHGACPNRMDPPTSHVLTNNIEGIEITEGPYDVENFGTLSGAVKITTKEPEKGFGGEINLNVGSWGYRKGALSLHGGTDKVRALVSVSAETSEQYEDGDGNNFAEQIENYVGNSTSKENYKEEYRDMDAYDKRTFMGKVFVDFTEDQELGLSYTANRSDDVLYPSSKMDALYDDSDIINVDYKIRNLGEYSKQLDVQYYLSKVEHPMSTFYRVSSTNPMNPTTPNSDNEVISKLTTRAEGVKVKNTVGLSDTTDLKIGADFSKRNWDGDYEIKGMMSKYDGIVSIDDVDTTNSAVFAEVEQNYDNFNLRVGARYDDTTIEPTGTVGQQSNEYRSLGGFIFGTYQANGSTKLFGGVGRASRVPDARELYFRNMRGVELGTPTLDQTTNTEIDFGVESNFESLTLKAKLFHSWLTDYIYFNSSNPKNKFENIDATIYGLDIGGSYFATDDLYLDFGLAYQRGKKDEPLTGQTDKDLAEIPPMKVNLALNYEYMPNSSARMEVIYADDWDDFDADNGEQKLDSYTVVNLKVNHELTKSIELTAGVDNVFDKTYAVSNTYNDLILLTDGLTDEVILMNEPGRYFYLNGTYKF
ncbi:MAG: TonB-dependent receptor [Pseudomonadota bacterium]